MLKDRRLLVEKELKIVQDQAAHMYLDIVISDGDVHSDEYQLLREKAGKLQFDLNLINRMIDRGHE